MNSFVERKLEASNINIQQHPSDSPEKINRLNRDTTKVENYSDALDANHFYRWAMQQDDSS